MTEHCRLPLVMGLVLLAGSACTHEEHESAKLRAAVSTEVAVEKQAVHRPAPGRWPALAFDGDQYLAVWGDERALRPVLHGARITADGTVLDPTGFPILDVGPLPYSTSWFRPAVAAGPDGFLVVTEALGQIYGVRVSAAGEVLDPEGLVLASPASYANRPSVAFGGGHYLVAWSHASQPQGVDPGVYRARVKPNGTVLDPEGALVEPLALQQTAVGVSFDGTNHLLSWADYDADTDSNFLNAARVAPDGAVIDEPPILVSPPGVDVEAKLGPLADFDGTNHVIAWWDGPFGGPEFRILVSRLTPDGAVLDPKGIVAVSDQYNVWEYAHRVQLAASAGRSTVVWSGYSGADDSGYMHSHPVRAARVVTDGEASVQLLDKFPQGAEATVAAHSDGSLLLWRDGASTNANFFGDFFGIVGMRLDDAGMPILDDPIVPASIPSRQKVEAVASDNDNDNYFVLWTDTRDPTSDGRGLYGARLSAGGFPLDNEAIQFTSLRADLADVVFDGANYVVTWVRFTCGECDGNLHQMVRVSAAGERLDAEPRMIPLDTPGGYVLAGASDGTHTLLLGAVSSWQGDYLAGVLLDQAGEQVGGHIAIEKGWVHWPAVTFDGTHYLVVWKGHHVWGQRITTAGAFVGDHFSIAQPQWISELDVAGGKGLNLVVWQTNDGIWASRVSKDGQVLDPGGFLVVVPEPVLGDGNSPSVAFDGETFVVAWRAGVGDESSLDLFAAEVGVEGDVSAPFPISAAPEDEGAPFLVGGDGRVLAAYARYVPGAPDDTYRARARMLLPGLDSLSELEGWK